jgi:hypothetical protein
MIVASLKPNLTRTAAARLLDTKWQKWRRGSLRAVLDFYIPYRLFRVATTRRGKPTQIFLALDLVTGQLAPYHFDEPLAEDAQLPIETERRAPVGIDEATALASLNDCVMRLAFLNGIFKIRRYRFAAEPIADFYLPYWIGVFERGGAVELEAIDAVRGRLEGAKIREIAVEWFQRSSRK